MILLLSPTKTMQSRPSSQVDREGLFPAERDAVRRALEGLGPDGRAEVWGIKDKLLAKTEAMFGAFAFEKADTAALDAYAGLQFKNLDAANLSDAERAFCRQHLLIVSALYGLLRPDDAVMPYRLEMQARLAVSYGGQVYPSLYRFWSERLNAFLETLGERPVNLCSGEYAEVFQAETLARLGTVHCHFGELKGGKFKAFGTRSKQARGQLARFVVTEKLVKPEDLRRFEWEGLRFDASLSDEANYYYTATKS